MKEQKMKLLMIIALCLSFTTLASAPIKEVKQKPDRDSFQKLNKASDASKPLILSSKDDALKYITKDLLDLLKVDFTKQKLLVFAWKGSGQDKIDYVVMESFPEQITFSYKRGRTRDLRQHCKFFIIRKNVLLR